MIGVGKESLGCERISKQLYWLLGGLLKRPPRGGNVDRAGEGKQETLFHLRTLRD